MTRPRWWQETWGDVVWRHNMLVLLTGFGIIAAFCVFLWWSAHEAIPRPFRDLEIWRGLGQQECPPEWQCNGRPDTNNPRCP